MTSIAEQHDAVLFDLDGVVYLGPEPVPGAAQGIAALRERGVQVGFVTNNAARSPETVAAHLAELGISAEAGDVVTSAQAGARMLAAQLSAGARVLVLGSEALVAEVEALGLHVVADAASAPQAVIQGYHPQLHWPQVDEAGFAIQAGAVWVATNTDRNRPTDRGPVAGAGAQIDAVRAAVKADPQVAGKPYPPLLEETVRRLEARNPIFVGDRIDTDIDGAAGVGMDSLFVFTGAHGKADVVAAHNRPTHIGWDLRALLEAPAQPTTRLVDGRFSGPLETREQQLDALRALLATLPPGSDPAAPETAALLDQLDQLP